MHSWRFLLAFVAILQPISSFTERSFVNGRQECCDRQPPPLLERNKQTLDGTRAHGRELFRNRILNSREDLHDTRRYNVQQRDQLIRTSVGDFRNTRVKPTSRQSTDTARIELRLQRIGSIERRAVRETAERGLKNRRNAERDNSNLRANRHIISDSLRRYEPHDVRESRIDVLSQNVRKERSIFHRGSRGTDNQRFSSVVRAEVLGKERRVLSEREKEIRVRDESDARDNRRVFTERGYTERNVLSRPENRRSDDINSERHVRSFLTRYNKYEERRTTSHERRMIDNRRTHEADGLRLAGDKRDINRLYRNQRTVDREIDQSRRTELSRRVNRDAIEFRNSLEATRRDVGGNRRSRDASIRRQTSRDEETRPRFIPTRLLNREERNEIKRGNQFRRVDTTDRRSQPEGRFDYRDYRRDIRHIIMTTEIIPVRDTSSHRMATRTRQNDNVVPETRFRVMSSVEKEKPIANDNMFMNWPTVLYTLQGIYLCGIFIQMFYDNGKEQQKLKNVRWWTTATKLIKME